MLPNEYLPHLKEGAGAPRFLFGWAFNRAWTLELARRRRLTFDVSQYFRRHFGGCETFNFADVTEDHLKLPMLRQFLGEVAFECVCDYIEHETHAQFDIREPVSDKWDRMFVLWTNYDMKESYRRFQITATWWKVKEFMDEAMNEGLPAGSDRSESLWWWAVSGNTLVCSKSTVSSIIPLTGMLIASLKRTSHLFLFPYVPQRATHIPHVSIPRHHLGLQSSYFYPECMPHDATYISLYSTNGRPTLRILSRHW